MGDWRDWAVCRDLDPGVFYPVPTGSVYKAKLDDRYDDALAVCARCPVAAECLADNLYETDGVFGATTPAQRQAMRDDAGIVLPNDRRPRRPRDSRPDNPALTHGTLGGYRRGCRCRPCAEAENAYSRARYHQRRAATA